MGEREIQRTYRGKATREEDHEHDGTERAVVVAVYGQKDDEEARLAELAALLDTAGAEVEEVVVQHRDRPEPRTYLGKGRLEDLQLLVKDLKPDLVVVDAELTAGQQRQLEDRLKKRVVDRTGLILDIFALHATTAEGKLQVELAQLEYSYSRQEGLWQHLERLGGGVGTRGPGETQLESDRRLLRNRMGALRRRLADVARSRDVMRSRRLASDAPRVALAGYTNAGKSSLMNALTGADVSTADALFETLDSTTRALELGSHRVLLSDTVGFVRDLPHELVEAFASTLDEVRDADLILHVADATEHWRTRDDQAAAVERTLEEIGAGEVPRLRVLNKIDGCAPEERGDLSRERSDAVLVSARTGEGLDDLRDRLLDVARARLTPVDVLIPYSRGELVSSVYASGREIEQEAEEDGTRMRALLPERAAAILLNDLRNGSGPTANGRVAG
jgi:GTP-binding protein HflX